MKITEKPEEIFREYEKAVAYNQSIGLYENVEKNEDFYHDRQWGSVAVPGMDQPVFNFLKPVVNYYVSMIVSDDVSMDFAFGRGKEEAEALGVRSILQNEMRKVLEGERMRFRFRELLRDMAVRGDMCLYSYFDPDYKNGLGAIRAERVANTDVYFGDPYDPEVENQPYILLKKRCSVAEAKEMALRYGMDAEAVRPDPEEDGGLYGDKNVTVLWKFFKENGRVQCLQVTKDVVIRPKTDLEYDRYPLSFMSWEREGRSYHGVSPLTGKRPNQVFVNKLYAMAMEYAKNMAFPKLLYNKTKIPKWDGAPGKAIAVNGDPREALFASFPAADMSAQALSLANATVVQTKEMMGAYDAALGNINPTNTSAIIAVQQAASMPLDLQRLDFYQFVEDTLRVWLSIMTKDYGLRVVEAEENGEEVQKLFDFGTLENYGPSLMVEVGPSAYWSEIRQIQSLDNLLANQIIPDAATYLESMPEGYIRGKRKILEKVKRKAEIEAAEHLMGGVL